MLNSEKVCRLLEKGLDPNFHDPDTGGQFHVFLWIRERFPEGISSAEFPIPSRNSSRLLSGISSCSIPVIFLEFYGTIPTFQRILGILHSLGISLSSPVPSGVHQDTIPISPYSPLGIFSLPVPVSNPGLSQLRLDEGIGISQKFLDWELWGFLGMLVGFPWVSQEVWTGCWKSRLGTSQERASTFPVGIFGIGSLGNPVGMSPGKLENPAWKKLFPAGFNPINGLGITGMSHKIPWGTLS